MGRISDLTRHGAEEYRGAIEVLQEPGDIVYVPDAWTHAVLNVAEYTVSVSIEFDEPDLSEEEDTPKKKKKKATVTPAKGHKASTQKGVGKKKTKALGKSTIGRSSIFEELRDALLREIRRPRSKKNDRRTVVS